MTQQNLAPLAVVIASVGRPTLVLDIISRLQAQSEPPTQIIVSVPDMSSLPEPWHGKTPPDLTIVTGARGLTAQRNAGIAALSTEIELVVFFDDDAIPHAEYLEQASRTFHARPDVVGLTGLVLADGAAEDVPVPLAKALGLLAEVQSLAEKDIVAQNTSELYGCNFAIRRSVLSRHLFDERLRLYSWLEDLDFARRISRDGALIKVENCIIVHLGSASGGRTQHRRFGYSQITNPLYLLRKRSIRVSDAIRLIAKPLASNIIHAVRGPQSSWRRQRIVGNWMSLRDLARRRMTPERIENIN